MSNAQCCVLEDQYWGVTSSVASSNQHRPLSLWVCTNLQPTEQTRSLWGQSSSHVEPLFLRGHRGGRGLPGSRAGWGHPASDTIWGGRVDHGDGDVSLRQGGLWWGWRPCSLTWASPGTPAWSAHHSHCQRAYVVLDKWDTWVMVYKYTYSCESQWYFEDPNSVLDPVKSLWTSEHLSETSRHACVAFPQGFWHFGCAFRQHLSPVLPKIKQVDETKEGFRSCLKENVH